MRLYNVYLRTAYGFRQYETTSVVKAFGFCVFYLGNCHMRSKEYDGNVKPELTLVREYVKEIEAC